MNLQSVDIGLVSASESLADFYERTLNASRLEPRIFPFATIHRLSLGIVNLKIMVPTTSPALAPQVEQFWDVAGLRYVTLWVDDVMALADDWVANGGTIAMAPTELRSGVYTSMLIDPDGNTIEAMQQNALQQVG